MAPSEQEDLQADSYIVEASADTFAHAAWLSAVHSEVFCVSDADHSLRISPVSDLLRGEFKKIGASVTGVSRKR